MYATDSRNYEFSGKAHQYLAARLGDMGELLRDADARVVFTTLEFLRMQTEIPVGLHGEVVVAGRTVLPLLAKAKLAAESADPDPSTEKLAKDFGFSWKLLAEKTGLPMAAIKAEIHAAAAYAKSGEVFELAEFMR